MKNVIIGTAGHIDHGKTEMVKALTNIDTDRLKEEKLRGISIELGFAFYTLPSGIKIGIVDVPGHEKFIKNMLAGVAGIDIVLLVIAADEGVMPQTREHMDILELLNIKKGIIVLSKTDLVDEEWLELIKEDIRESLSSTFLQDAPLIEISSRTKKGFDLLIQELEKSVTEVEPKSNAGKFRLPVDRVFTVKGFGTVITGTVWQGKVNTGEMVEILPWGKRAKIRNIQVHGFDVDEASAGQRTAIALQGIEKNEIDRGDTLCAPDFLEPGYLLDVRLNVLKTCKIKVKNRLRIRFYLGTQEAFGRLILLDKEELFAGEQGLLQIRLESPVIAHPGDRFVVRTYSPLLTIAGGTVLDAKPTKHKRFKDYVINKLELHEKGTPKEIVENFILDSGSAGLDFGTLIQKSGREKDEMNSILSSLQSSGSIQIFTKNLYYHNKTIEEMTAELVNVLENYHKQFRLRSGISREELKNRITKIFPGSLYEELIIALDNQKKILISSDKIALSGFKISFTSAQQKLHSLIIEIYRKSRFSPPALEQLINEELNGQEPKEIQNMVAALVETGELEKITTDFYLTSEAVAEIKKRLIDYLSKKPEITVGEFKELTSISRKYAIPFLEYFDKKRITRRVGDKRILN
jgi:selenocysteine-specific elongation factor